MLFPIVRSKQASHIIFGLIQRIFPSDHLGGTGWNHPEQIEKAQEMLIQRALEIFPTELSRLHLDYSNQFTFIDSFNNRFEICKRGHNKQKRDDLRQFSLILITSAELQIPLVWELYDGNKNDKSEFA